MKRIESVVIMLTVATFATCQPMWRRAIVTGSNALKSRSGRIATGVAVGCVAGGYGIHHVSKGNRCSYLSALSGEREKVKLLGSDEVLGIVCASSPAKSHGMVDLEYEVELSSGVVTRDELLLAIAENHIDPNMGDTDGRSFVAIALEHGDEELLRYLFAVGAKE